MVKRVCQWAAIAMLLGIGSVANAWTITVKGTIRSHDPDRLGVFAPAGTVLFGMPYTQRISTDPAANAYNGCSSISCYGTIGGNFPYYCCGTGAPFVVTTVVNGEEFTYSELDPFLNIGYVIDALSIGDTSTTLQDQVNQRVWSNGCSNVFLSCVDAYALAYSLSSPFVPRLGFDQRIYVDSGLDPGSNAYFSYRPQPDHETWFEGSIDSIRVEPGTGLTIQQKFDALALAATGVGPGKSLYAHVRQADAFYTAGDKGSSCSSLVLFVQQVQRQSPRKIGTAVAADLIFDAEAIQDDLACW